MNFNQIKSTSLASKSETDFNMDARLQNYTQAYLTVKQVSV